MVLEVPKSENMTG